MAGGGKGKNKGGSKRSRSPNAAAQHQQSSQSNNHKHEEEKVESAPSTNASDAHLLLAQREESPSDSSTIQPIIQSVAWDEQIAHSNTTEKQDAISEERRDSGHTDSVLNESKFEKLLQEQRSANALLESQLVTMSRTSSVLGAQNAELQSQLAKLQKEFATTLQEIQAKLDKSLKEEASQRMQIKALESHTNQEAKTIADLRSKVDAVTASAAAAAAKASSETYVKTKGFEAQVSQLQEMVKTREIEMHAGMMERERLTRDCSQKDATIQRLKAVNKHLEDTLAKSLAEPFNASLKTGLLWKDIHRFSRDHWIADSSSVLCSHPGCNARFSLVQRKHHCRCCGMIFCASHSLKKSKVSLSTHQLDPNGVLTRVCDSCYSSS